MLKYKAHISKYVGHIFAPVKWGFPSMVGKGFFPVNVYSFFGCKGEWIFCCSGCVTIPVVNAGFAKSA